MPTDPFAVLQNLPSPPCPTSKFLPSDPVTHLQSSLQDPGTVPGPPSASCDSLSFRFHVEFPSYGINKNQRFPHLSVPLPDVGGGEGRNDSRNRRRQVRDPAGQTGTLLYNTDNRGPAGAYFWPLKWAVWACWGGELWRRGVVEGESSRPWSAKGGACAVSISLTGSSGALPLGHSGK